MSKKKDKVVTFIGSGLTDTQASNLIGEIAKAKNKVAPNCRATAAQTTEDKLASILGRNLKGIDSKK
ncbi:MAG: hypothetical protein IKI77_07905 [Oscillospiraceae bacterium]|nr:hypothetical protein [Oscillospiraceae bacterium]